MGYVPYANPPMGTRSIFDDVLIVDCIKPTFFVLGTNEVGFIVLLRSVRPGVQFGLVELHRVYGSNVRT